MKLIGTLLGIMLFCCVIWTGCVQNTALLNDVSTGPVVAPSIIPVSTNNVNESSSFNSEQYIWQDWQLRNKEY